jgi:protein-L-isoaspartate(D-aspartate) O-methyltransferase
MASPAGNDPFRELRLQMVEAQLRARGIYDARVLDAMARISRHEFAPERYRSQAYEDHPLPIGEEQTISQPYMVALMLQALAISPNDSVLEIGTGSGYVTALLAELASRVMSIERHRSLADSAAALLSRMGFRNIQIVTGDGSRGFPQSAPYDVIIVSAAAPELPRELVAQLAEGGRMIVPVGIEDSQQLQFIEMRDGKSNLSLRELCRFVPLIAENRS